jgi:PhzF family phenazine biosynthesis protein
MNLSETGFLFTSQKADFRLRFFTPPGDEIKFCGHATVGALCAIAKERLFGCHDSTKTRLSIETNAGILKVKIDSTNPRTQFIFDAPKIDLVPAPYTLDQVIQAMGISKDLIDNSKPLMLEKTNNYLYFAARNLNCLAKIKPDMQLTTDFAKKDRIVIFCVLTNETFNPNYQLHARGFAPLVGVPEDPFTGSMQGGLAAYAFQEKMIDPHSEWIKVEQGHFMERPGYVKLEVTQQDPIHVKLHAEAVHLFSSYLNL